MSLNHRPLVGIIDDDPVYIFIIKNQLINKTSITDILDFEYGEDALTFLKENKDHPKNIPDIIFLDLEMPMMNGWEFLIEYQKIINLLTKKPKIYLTSFSVYEKDLKKAAAIDEVKELLTKPLDSNTLKNIIF